MKRRNIKNSISTDLPYALLRHLHKHVRASDQKLVHQQLGLEAHDSSINFAFDGVRDGLYKDGLLRWIIARLSSELEQIKRSNRRNVGLSNSFLHGQFFRMNENDMIRSDSVEKKIYEELRTMTSSPLDAIRFFIREDIKWKMEHE